MRGFLVSIPNHTFKGLKNGTFMCIVTVFNLFGSIRYDSGGKGETYGMYREVRTGTSGAVSAVTP